MTIRLHNVLERKKVPFQPISDEEVRIYVCGVTVYGRCHVGHLRCYLSFDSILRYLAYKGHKLNFVRNFTDIDDKIIARAREIAAGPKGDWRSGDAYINYNASQWEARLAEDQTILKRSEGQDRHLAEIVSDHFIDVFRNEDFAPFDLLPATSEPRVSEKIDEVVALVARIIERGFAYEADGDVYFDVPAYHDATGAYGKLSGRDYTQMAEGARVAPTDKKRSAPDFALWKRSSDDEPGWDSPWGCGRPGWHIECSAMSAAALGQPFDIHGGGKDLIFPHHENEIAQSEAATGTPYCNTWMHNGFVTVDGVKMSKSLGNFISIQEALDLAPPEVWRLLVLGTHYANPIDFSRSREVSEGRCAMVRGSIDIAFDRLEYFYETLVRADEAIGEFAPSENAPLIDDPRAVGVVTTFEEAMDDDFNTALGVAGLGESMKYVNEMCDMKAKQIKKLPGGRDMWLATLHRVRADMRSVLGALHLCTLEPKVALEQMRDFSVCCRNLDCGAIEKLVAGRQEARADKDWAKSDSIRDELAEMGVEVRDTPDGAVWKVIRS